jgi:MFS family permease
MVRNVPAARRPARLLFLGRHLHRAFPLLTDEQFFAFGWRIPFLASAVLVILGLYVRLTITETPMFLKVVDRQERVKVPMLAVMTSHPRMLVIGVLISLSVFVIFYLITVFALSWGTVALGYTREQFLWIQLFGILFFALTIPWSATMAERGRRGRRCRQRNGAI